MSMRVFPEETIRTDGSSVKVMKIACAHCGGACFFPFQTGFKRKPPIAAQQHFQNQGWVVGSGPRKDFCPLHARPSQRKGTKAMVETPVAASQAEPPPAYSREDRRTIMYKLEEVYAKDAYKAPWTDNAVAKDLGVPRAWVSEIRSANFGPEGSNPQLDEFLAARDRLDLEIKGLAERYDAAVKAFGEYQKGFADLRDQMTAQQHLARKIEREIGR